MKDCSLLKKEGCNESESVGLFKLVTPHSVVVGQA